VITGVSVSKQVFKKPAIAGNDKKVSQLQPDVYIEQDIILSVRIFKHPKQIAIIGGIF